MNEKVAVVTGASSGIGKAICNALLNENYYILANGRTINSVFQVSEHLLLNCMDMLNPQTSEKLMNEVLDKWISAICSVSMLELLSQIVSRLLT